MMPSVEDMLSMTQPSYNSPTQSQSKASKGRSRTATENSMDIDTTKAPRPSPVKRQRPETPPLPKSSWKKPKVEETEEAEPIHYIEILDSSSGSEREEPRHSRNTEPKSKSRRALPSQTKGSQKARRKRTPSPVASASTSRQPFQQRPVTPPRKPPRKRAKAGSYTKHPVHWHLDGSVLIQIGSMRFKLHRSVLVRHSEWFQHTFERGEDAPERASELVDNLPLYYLDGLGVDPHNFSVLLHALDDAITYVETEPPFATIASILLASSALTFTKFEAYAIRYLETMWSPDLADLTKTAIPYAFESMILARECALFSVLKRVMYELVRMQGFGQPAPTPDNRAPAVTLNAQDLNTLLHAREKLMTVWTAAADPDEFPPCAAEPEPLPQAGVPPPGAATHDARQILASDAPAAANSPALPRPCTATSRVDSKLAHDNLIKTTGILKAFRWDPLCGLQAMIEAPWDTEGFCEACVENRREVWEGERERVWEELDEWFGL
ncbi:hypothetical protein FPV67DRAFT_1493711 [Lyophyllum atratum]|nr:hypothetical protein FPV67DRAFT_1493711 [Lyophyllum atratum]